MCNAGTWIHRVVDMGMELRTHKLPASCPRHFPAFSHSRLTLEGSCEDARPMGRDLSLKNLNRMKDKIKEVNFSEIINTDNPEEQWCKLADTISNIVEETAPLKPLSKKQRKKG